MFNRITLTKKKSTTNPLREAFCFTQDYIKNKINNITGGHILIGLRCGGDENKRESITESVSTQRIMTEKEEKKKRNHRIQFNTYAKNEVMVTFVSEVSEYFSSSVLKQLERKVCTNTVPSRESSKSLWGRASISTLFPRRQMQYNNRVVAVTPKVPLLEE